MPRFILLIILLGLFQNCAEPSVDNTNGSAIFSNGEDWKADAAVFRHDNDGRVVLEVFTQNSFDLPEIVIQFRHIDPTTDTIPLRFIASLDRDSDWPSSSINTWNVDRVSESYELCDSDSSSNWLLFTKIRNRVLEGEFQASYFRDTSFTTIHAHGYPDTLKVTNGRFLARRL